MTSDMNQVQTGLNLALRLLLRSPFVVFGAMIMAFTVDSRAALMVCRGHSGAVGGGVWHHAHQHAAVQKGAAAAG